VDPGPGSTATQAIGVVTGLASEAAVIAAMLDENDMTVRVACAGASAERAALKARQLVDQGVGALMSFGIAGAADPGLDSGDLVIAREVLTEFGDLYACAPRWQEALCDALPAAHLPFRHGAILGGTKLWRDAADKEAIFAITGCLTLDMESAAVGAIAAEQGLPFLAVRAVADRAGDSLPGLVGIAVKPNGRPAVGRALAALIRNPGDIPATLRLARQSELALARLRMLEAVKAALFGGF
jgi:adenosylhomocysteine nucleosidase